MRLLTPIMNKSTKVHQIPDNSHSLELDRVLSIDAEAKITIPTRIN